MSSEEDKWSRDRLLEEVRHASDKSNSGMQIGLACLTIGIAILAATPVFPEALLFYRLALSILGLVYAVGAFFLLRGATRLDREYDRLKAKL